MSCMCRFLCGDSGYLLYLLSSCLLPNTFGSDMKDNVSSVKGSWGNSVVLHRCTSCYSALSAWRSPAETEQDCKPVASFSTDYGKKSWYTMWIIFVTEILYLSSIVVEYGCITTKKLVVLLQNAHFYMDFPNPDLYLAAFTSEQPVVVSWHFVSADGAALLWLRSVVLLRL